MKKILMTLAAVLCCTMTTLVLTSCTMDNNDNPSGDPTHDKAIVGNWCANITNRTFALWNYGPAWSKVTFNADGTGYFDTFYILEGESIARDHQTFTYTTTSDGRLTMVMKDGNFDYTYQISNGQLTLDYNGRVATYDKPDADMEAKFDEWSQQEAIKVPIPARYTVFVYGNAGGQMDNIIEKGFWERMKPLLTDSLNVRVVCFYKYGQKTSSEYDDDGDIVWFELNSKTDLNKLREEGFANYGLAEQAKKLKLCDPASLRMFMELSSLVCPAQEYIFTIWGHGSGFEPRFDVPGKYDTNAPLRRGVIADEWNDHEQLDMYELAQAIRESGAVGHLNTIFFHNCLMGNIETLTELRDVTKYICCSAHSLYSDGIVLSEFVRGLMEQQNTEDAVKQMFQEMRPDWDNQYVNETPEGGKLPNGDYKMLRTSKFDGILNATRQLATRLVEIYPTQREAIDRATTTVYRFHNYGDDPNTIHTITAPFFDLADYAHKLAQETGDQQLAAISDDIDRAFNDLFVHYADVNWNEQHLDHYTLSVCLYQKIYYTYDYIGAGNQFLSNINDGYEQSSFHKLTGWGNFLRLNEAFSVTNPSSEGGGPLLK